MPHDPRDGEFIDLVCSAVTGLIVAVHQGDRLRVIGELNLLLAGIIEHDATLAERPGDEPLRRAVERLDAGWRHPP